LDVVREEFTEDERAILAPHFTNLDGPVFALVGLPEVVKGALFARYSRSPKSLRRLFLDEFAEAASPPPAGTSAGVRRAEQLYERVFLEYGDDSVAQLGGVHLACEQASQILTKVLERGRLAAYLEQSTRYVPYDDRPGGRWRYHVPPEVEALPDIAARYRSTLDRAFETYAKWLGPLQDFYRERFPKDPADSDFVHRMTIRAKACDTLRGLLPVATRTNVGIYATAQSYEQLLLRMRAHPLLEVRGFGDLMLEELRKVIPAFLVRVDRPDRGGAWSDYLRNTREATADLATSLLAGEPASGPQPSSVALASFDPDGEAKVVAAALYEHSSIPFSSLLERAQRMTVAERAEAIRVYTGDRTNRRHRPGRAFEAAGYRFDILCDYGAFRDLQRHRPLTIEWQRLSPEHGFSVSPDVEPAGAGANWASVMEGSAALFDVLTERCGPLVAQYALSMAYHVRFTMELNAREALHLIELRSSPQGHPVYRAIAWEMHRLIREQAGHEAIAGAMRFLNRSEVDLERLDAERRTEAQRGPGPVPARS
jgi:thymidylate synthase ThyX